MLGEDSEIMMLRVMLLFAAAWLTSASQVLAERTSIWGTWAGVPEGYTYTVTPMEITVTEGRCAFGLVGYPRRQTDRCDQDLKKGTLTMRLEGRGKVFLTLQGGRLVGTLHLNYATAQENIHKLSMVNTEDVMHVSALGADEIRRALADRKARIFPTLLASFGANGVVSLTGHLTRSGPYLVENGKLCLNWPDIQTCWAVDRRGSDYVIVTKDARLIRIE